MEEEMTTIIANAEAIRTLIDDLICHDVGIENQNRLHAVYVLTEDLIRRAGIVSEQLTDAEA